MTVPRLAWDHGSTPRVFRAMFGDELQGLALVHGHALGWSWAVDVLPDDIEPRIFGRAPLPTMEDAMRAAEAQVAAWPSLIEGAVR